jgi:FHS family L-fucose permease-like MFS transporter
MTVLFFMWGFMPVFNDILIPRFKDAFALDYFHAMLVQFAFYGWNGHKVGRGSDKATS